MWGQIASAVLGVGGGILGYVLNKRNADSSHQREVKDLQKAGLNPMISAMGGSGAPQPQVPDFGESAQRGLNSSLAVQRQKAELALLTAQTRKTSSEAMAVEALTPADLALRQSQGRFSELSVEEKRAALPDLIAQVRAQLKQTTSSARNVEALALLNEAALKGAKNTEALERALSELGIGGAAVRMLLEVLRSARR